MKLNFGHFYTIDFWSFLLHNVPKYIQYKTSQLFGNAHTALIEQNIQGFENQMFFVIDHIIDRLEKEPKLLQFISKNLSWGIFKNAFEKTVPENSRQFYDYYQDMLTQNHISCENQELMLFTILELVGSTCYSCILYQQPVSMEEYLPYLHQTIRQIFITFTKPMAERLPISTSNLSHALFNLKIQPKTALKEKSASIFVASEQGLDASA